MVFSLLEAARGEEEEMVRKIGSHEIAVTEGTEVVLSMSWDQYNL